MDSTLFGLDEIDDHLRERLPLRTDERLQTNEELFIRDIVQPLAQRLMPRLPKELLALGSIPFAHVPPPRSALRYELEERKRNHVMLIYESISGFARTRSVRKANDVARRE